MRANLELMQQQLGAKKGSLISQDTVDELDKLIDDPDYGEEFLDSYMQHFNILEQNGAWSTPKYMNALKFFTLIEANHAAVDAYVKVFPDRLQSRLDKGQSKTDMGGEASRFNASALVNEIRKVATIPVQLIHRHLLHESILKQASLMNDIRVSPAVQQKAAEALMRELKPAEDSTIELKVGMTDDAKSQQNKLIEHIGQIALNQQKMLASGMSIAEIQRLNIIKDEVIEGEIDE